MAGRRAPSFSGADGWQQSPPRSITQFRGSVLVVWFYSLSVRQCLRMVPALRALHAKDGVDVVGVHAPDFARDADPQAVALASAREGVTFPVVLDHRRTVFHRWQAERARAGWPVTYVVDPDGLVAATIQGTDTDRIQAAVNALLA